MSRPEPLQAPIVDSVHSKFLEKQQEFTKFFRADKDRLNQLGIFPHLHLCIEKLIWDYAKAIVPELNSLEDKIGRGFNQKLDTVCSLDGCEPWFRDHVPALKALNYIRNRFAHELEAVELPKEQLGIIRRVIEADYKKQNEGDKGIANYQGIDIVSL